MTKQTNYVIILSGGSGNRFGNDMPKQFADVYGKTILDYCISNFNNHPNIDKIIVVSNPEHIQRTKQIASKTKFNKIVSVVEGGSTRGKSSYLGLQEIANNEVETNGINVLIQDAVRPNTKAVIIDQVLECLKENKAATVAIATTDTIYIADENETLKSIPNRERIFKAQTPQGFNFELIYTAYQNLEKVNRFKQTDDCSIIKKVHPEETIRIIPGDINNLKITFYEDLEYFRQMLKSKS